jgi:hypothetical protein
MQSLNNQGFLVITAGESLTNGYQLRAQPIIRLWAPALWTAAALTMQGSRNGQDWDDLYDQAGAEISLAIAAATTNERSYAMPREWTLGCEYIRFRSGTAATPVAQAADRLLAFTFRPFA